jgi:hypothetical protein
MTLGDEVETTPVAPMVLLLAVLEEVRAGRLPGEPGTAETDNGILLRALAVLRELREEMTSWEPELITAARNAGTSWAQLALALGVASRQAAERRYLRLRPTGNGETTGEARVQATRDQRAGDRAVLAWARENTAVLRQVAGQIGGLRNLNPAGQREADRIRTELAGDDATTLLAPLSQMLSHLAADHPALAARITKIAEDADRQRNDALDRRQSSAPDTALD